MYSDALPMKALDGFEKQFYEKFQYVDFECLDYYAFKLKDFFCTKRSTWDTYAKL